MSIRKDSISYKIFEVFRRRKACITNEIEKDTNLPQNVASRYIEILIEQGLIIKSDIRVQSPTRKCSRYIVYGLTWEDIRRKEKDIESNITEEQFLTGLYEIVFKILKNSKEALTPYEVLLEVQKIKPDYNNLGWIATICRDLERRGIGIKRSPFRLPRDSVPGITSDREAYAYGVSDEQVKEKVLKLAPKPVRDCFHFIQNEAKINASFYLRQRTGMTISQDECNGKKPMSYEWLIQRFYKAGWLKYRSYKNMGYFWRNSLPDDMVERQILEFDPKAREYLLGTQELGRLSEKRGLFVYVMWQKFVEGRKITIPEGFPEKIPSWFVPEDHEKYTLIEKTKNGRERKILKSGVWRYYLNPLDFIVLEDPSVRTMSPSFGWAVNCKYTTNKANEQLLKDMFTSLKEGFVYKMKTGESDEKVARKTAIPYHSILKPAILCKGTFGSLFWARVMEYGADIVTYPSLLEMEKILKEKFGIAYPKAEEVDLMMKKVQYYDKYQRFAFSKGLDAVKMVLEAVKDEQEKTDKI